LKCEEGGGKKRIKVARIQVTFDKQRHSRKKKKKKTKRKERKNEI